MESLLKRKNIEIKYMLLFSTILMFILVFIMLIKSPFRLDDLTWGGQIGIDRLNSRFEGYNGRYFGNFTVLLLTRFPSILRTFIETSVILTILYFVFLILKKSITAFSFFIILFFFMPLTIFTQTITWVSGFSNYVFSAAFVMMILYVDLELLNSNRFVLNRNVIKYLYYFLVLIGQLYLETGTIYAVSLSLFSVVYYRLKYKKMSKTLTAQLLIAIIGATIMFSNSAYLSAFTHDGNTYKSIQVSGNIISRIIQTYTLEIYKPWLGINNILNLILSILLVLVSIKSESKYEWIATTIGVGFVSFFLYDVLDGNYAIMISQTIGVIVSVLFVIYIVLVSYFCLQSKDNIFTVIIMMVSNFVLMLPLNIISPINDRCFFNTYVLWVITVALIAKELFENTNSERSLKILFLVTTMLNIYLLNSLKAQSLSWEIEEMRMDAIKECKENNLIELHLPRDPQSDLYCYGTNLGSEYWLNNYKRYYDIDEKVDLQFVDYEDYLNELE